MPAITMKDYLSAVEPDSYFLLNINPQESIVELAELNQEVFEADDNSEVRISYDDDPLFRVRCRWPRKNESDVGTIFDAWLDVNKGNGIVKTFKWRHPTDTYTYVARFDSSMQRTIRLINVMGIAEVVLKVFGYFEEYTHNAREDFVVTESVTVAIS